MKSSKVTSIIFSFLTVFLLSSFSAISPKKYPNYIKFSNKDSKEELLETIAEVYDSGKTPVLVYAANWCGSCMKFKETYNKSETTRKSLSNIVFLEIDLTKMRKKDYDKLCVKLASERNISKIPAFTMVDRNAEELNRVIGASWMNSEGETNSFLTTILTAEEAN